MEFPPDCQDSLLDLPGVAMVFLTQLHQQEMTQPARKDKT
jgi:hypothetical protein